jgi:hypothetical protein
LNSAEIKFRLAAAAAASDSRFIAAAPCDVVVVQKSFYCSLIKLFMEGKLKMSKQCTLKTLVKVWEVGTLEGIFCRLLKLNKVF